MMPFFESLKSDLGNIDQCQTLSFANHLPRIFILT
jgi:hypothetical protein